MVENSVKSHNHTQPTHTHSFSGQLVPTALTGTADGQNYSSSVNLTDSGTAAGQRYSDSVEYCGQQTIMMQLVLQMVPARLDRAISVQI